MAKNKQKHVPIRTCIVTKVKKPKMELMRIVRVDDVIKVDPKGKERGRGANICMDIKVFNKAVRKHLIERALKLERKFTKKEIEKLRKDFQEAIEEKRFRKGRKPVVMRVGKNGKGKVIEK
ncbi:YlxR family protein [Candidatus Dojkabacteria bacterium]|nr:YlxR family protein [Candidatus Dojkabacteria bacterium]